MRKEDRVIEEEAAEVLHEDISGEKVRGWDESGGGVRVRVRGGLYF